MGTEVRIDHVFEKEGSLGLNLKPANNKRGAVVSGITNNTLPDCITVGASLAAVNNECVTEMEFRALIDFIKSSPRPLHISFFGNQMHTQTVETSLPPAQRDTNQCFEADVTTEDDIKDTAEDNVDVAAAKICGGPCIQCSWKNYTL